MAVTPSHTFIPSLPVASEQSQRNTVKIGKKKNYLMSSCLIYTLGMENDQFMTGIF